MQEYEMYRELKEIIKHIEEGTILPSDIKQSFQDNYGTIIDVSWFDNMGDPLVKDIGIIQSMLISANELVELTETSVQADLMYPAILFCYIHYLELALKTIAERNNRYYDKIDSTKKISIKFNTKHKGHDISNTWSQVKGVIIDQLKLSENEKLCIDEIVENITSLSNTSMALRYARDLKGNEYFDNSKFGADLKVIYIWMNVLDEYLAALYDEDWELKLY